MEVLNILSAFGLSASAGLNAYIPLLAVALIGRFTNIMKLSEPWDTLESWWIIGLLVVLSLVEFFADKVPAFGGLTTHMGLLFAVVASVILWLILSKSRWGYEIRLIGDNPRAAEYAGISIKKNIVYVMLVSGALAGLAGMSEIAGVVHRLQGAISSGYGYTGIIIAWLAKLNPLAVILVSILFGALILAGREVQPSGIPTMIQGVIMVCLIASDFFLRNKVTIRRRVVED